MDELGTGLLTSWWAEPEDKEGYSVYTGIRYDLDDLRLKLGLEFNYGTKNWISFTTADEFYVSKLATRGYVAEIYSIYDIPTVDFSAWLNKGFVRVGYKYFDYEYTGSGSWLGKPEKIDDIANDPLASQFYAPDYHDHMIYMVVDLYF
ncbi:MAG: DUF3373 family protein [Thermodesulfobacteriota bacterium]